MSLFQSDRIQIDQICKTLLMFGTIKTSTSDSTAANVYREFFKGNLFWNLLFYLFDITLTLYFLIEQMIPKYLYLQIL